MGEKVRAWHPDVPLVREVLHARFEQHAYPAHTHDAWTVLLIDDGAVAYELDRRPHHAVPATITLLPPHVPHDGKSAVSGTAFRKRVLYLEDSWLPDSAIGAASADPLVRDPVALSVLNEAFASVAAPTDALLAEGAILSLRARVLRHLGEATSTATDRPLARRLRDLLDAHLSDSFTIAEAARLLGVHPSHLVRVFSQTYGVAPHRYVTGRRVDYARRLLVEGRSQADAAAEAGFHDQSHLSRHFRRYLGASPGAFVAKAT